MPTCGRGCGFESLIQVVALHEKTCFTPRTLDRLREIGGVTEGPDDCWLWRNPRTGKISERYGRVAGDLVHRLAYEIATGERVRLPKMVCHTCDVHACFNPAHLFAGTQTDNMRDMGEKGRGAGGRPEMREMSRRTAKKTWETASPEVRAARIAAAAANMRNGQAQSNHVRWHVRRGVISETCSLCAVPAERNE